VKKKCLGEQFIVFYYFFGILSPPIGEKEKTFITKDSSKLEVNEWDELLFYTCSKIYTPKKGKERIFSLKLKARGDFNLSVVKR